MFCRIRVSGSLRDQAMNFIGLQFQNSCYFAGALHRINKPFDFRDQGRVRGQHENIEIEWLSSLVPVPYGKQQRRRATRDSSPR